MVTNRIITDVDDGSAIEDDHKFTRWKDGDPEPYETAFSRIRTAAQQGTLGTPSFDNSTRILTFPVRGGSPIEVSIPGGTVDLSGKLDIDLQNADASMTVGEQTLFANRAGLLKNTLDNLANLGLITAATRSAWRSMLNVAVAPTVYPTEGTTIQISATDGEFIHFSDTGHTYLCTQTITLQARLVAESSAFSQIHLERATAGEMRAGTESELRANSPSLIKEAIDALVQYANINDRPFIFVEPGSAIPTPTAQNEEFLVVAGTAQSRIIYHQQLTHGNALSVTYRGFNSSDLSSGNYRGEVNYTENLPTDASDGDVYFVRNDHGLRIWNDGASQWGNVFWTAGEWLGSFHSKNAADQAVGAHYPSGESGTPVGKHLSYGGTLATQELYTITAYTPDSADVRSWKPIFSGGGGGGGGVTDAEVDSKIATHNAAATAHADIRTIIANLDLGEDNVQADWEEADGASDAFIQNKPTIPDPDGVVDSVDLSLSGQTLTVTVERTVGDDLSDSATLPSGGEGTSDYNALENRPIRNIATVSNLPTPSSANTGERYQTNDGRQYRSTRIIVHGDTRVVNWSAYSSTNYQGALDDFSDLPDNPLISDEGKWWLIRSACRDGIAPFVRIDGNADKQSLSSIPDSGKTFLGVFHTEAYAAGVVTAADQVAAYPVSNDYDLYDVDSDFVPGTPDHDIYAWAPTDVDPNAPSGSGGVSEARVQEIIDTNKIETAPGAGDGGKLPTVAAADLRFLKKSGGTMTGKLTISSIEGSAGGEEISQFGEAAAKNVGTSSGELAELQSSGEFHARRLANNTPAAATTRQYLGNNSTSQARWRNLDPAVQNIMGTWLAMLDEFSYNAGNNELTFNTEPIEATDHFKGAYDNSVTYASGDAVSYEDNTWIVHDSTLANDNAPGNPAETTGWSQLSDRAGYRGLLSPDDTDQVFYHTGDRVFLQGTYQDFFFCKREGNFRGTEIANSVDWERFLSVVVLTGSQIATAIHGYENRSNHDLIIWEGAPENRLEYHSLGELIDMLTDAERLAILNALVDEIDGTPSNGQVPGWDSSNSRLEWLAAGISQASGDARYLRLTGGTLTGRTVIDRSGNNEAFVVQGHEATSAAIMKLETMVTGSQKAFQASRDGQNLAWASFEGTLGGSNEKPGLALGPGNGARDVELYRDGANVWRTPDAMHVNELRVDSGGRANSRSQLGLATALLSFALASDDEGIEFTRADGNTEEMTRAQLKTASGCDTTSAAMERDITWTGVSANNAILTNLTPPSNTRMIYIAFRQDEDDAWQGGIYIDYTVWNGYSAVTAGSELTDSNSWTFFGVTSSGGAVKWRVGKGTAGVLAVASERSSIERDRFDKICVRWIT